MVNKKFLRITVVLIALFVALLGHMNAGMAASVDSNGQALSLAFTVSGGSNNVSQVKSPNDYRTLNARFLDISKVPLQLTDVSNYVVKGLVGSDGEYHYPF